MITSITKVCVHTRHLSLQGKDGQSTVQIESTDNASDSDEDSTERKHGDCVICYQPLSKKVRTITKILRETHFFTV